MINYIPKFFIPCNNGYFIIIQLPSNICFWNRSLYHNSLTLYYNISYYLFRIVITIMLLAAHCNRFYWTIICIVATYDSMFLIIRKNIVLFKLMCLRRLIMYRANKITILLQRTFMKFENNFFSNINVILIFSLE